MKILAIEAERVRKLKLVRLKLDGEDLVVAGEPNKGKTTLINLLWMAMDAKKVGKEVIQTGENDGYIAIELGEPGKKYAVKVTRKFTATGGEAGRIKVESGQGKTLPAKFMTDLIDELSFDPLKFIKLEGQKQVNMLLDVSNVPIDELESIEACRAETYEHRRVAKKDVDRWKTIVGEKPEEVERVDIQKLADELTEIGEHNKQIEKGVELLAELKTKRESAQKSVTILTRELIEAKSAVEEFSIRIEKGEAKMNPLKIIDTAQKLEAMKNIQVINQKAEKWDAWDKNSETLVQAEEEVTELEGKMLAIEAEKKEFLSKAEWPVVGMDVREGEIYVDNILLKNCGESQKLQVSFAIAISLNPTLKCCRLDGAESLGATGRRNILEMAKANDYQVLMSRVSDNGSEDGELVIEEGVVQS